MIKLPTSTAMIPIVGLLVLAGAFFAVPPALAQTELDCPLPPDWTPPSVIAEQVEDGSVSLKDFALVARDRFRGASQGVTRAGQLYGSACLVRQEGGPWRSGSTYLVQLTPSGRVRYSREGHGVVGQTPQASDLFTNPFFAGNPQNRSGQLGLARF